MLCSAVRILHMIIWGVNSPISHPVYQVEVSFLNHEGTTSHHLFYPPVNEQFDPARCRGWKTSFHYKLVSFRVKLFVYQRVDWPKNSFVQCFFFQLLWVKTDLGTHKKMVFPFSIHHQSIILVIWWWSKVINSHDVLMVIKQWY